MNPLLEKKLALERLTFELKEIDLYDEDLGKQLSACYDQPEMVRVPTLLREIGGEQVRFELELSFEGDGLVLDHYKVVVPRKLEAPVHFIHNGVDSAILEKMMEAVDWKRLDAWPTRADYTSEDPVLVAYNAAFTELYRFGVLGEMDRTADVDRVLVMVDYLCWKYLEGTRMEEMVLEAYPGLVGIFRCEHPFPAMVHTGVPTRYIRDPFELNRLSQLAFSENYKNREIMNLNNLQKLQQQMEKLGFSKEMIVAMEEGMKADLPRFTLLEAVPTSKGAVELTLHFKQSGKSDFYYLNRMEAVHNQGRVLESGEHYQLMEYLANGTYKELGERLGSFYAAADQFRELKTDAALMVFRDADLVVELVRKVDGKVDYLHEDIKKEFNKPSIPQTFWLENGKGFERDQVVNLMQGRAVYREEMLNRDGHVYNAWMQLDTDKARDSYGNLGYRQYTDAYGFDVKAQLQEYKIAGLDNAKKMDALVEVLKDGGRPEVQVEKDGQKVKLFLETAVRYGKLNFYREDGRPEKREQFLREPAVGAVLDKNRGQVNEKENAQAQGMGV